MSRTSTCCAPGNGVRPSGGLPVIARAQQPPDHDLVALTGGTFRMGASDGPHPEDGEGPVRPVTLDPFMIAPLTVTNAAFVRFADATGYRTQAEAEGASFVFHLLVAQGTTASAVVPGASWWHRIEGANWRWPEGPNGPSAGTKPDHPAVHISRHDALAYCQWSGTRLPSEAEWEYAARGGLDGQPFPWGDRLEPGGEHRSNVWQGTFPHENTADDGHIGTAPALCFEANQYGLYAMTGNVWEWTSDRFTNLHSPRPAANPKGPLNGSRYVAKGGSYLCHASYCARYRTSSRQPLDPGTTAGNIGFRVAAQ